MRLEFRISGIELLIIFHVLLVPAHADWNDWSVPKLISPGHGVNFDVLPITDNAGLMHVFYIANLASDTIGYCHSSGTGWTEPTEVLYIPDTYIWEFSAVFDQYGVLHAAFIADGEYPRAVYYATWDGQHWSPLEYLDSFAYEVDIGISNDGRAYVVYSYSSGVGCFVKLREFNGEEWEDYISICYGYSRGSSHPRIDVDSQGVAHIVCSAHANRYPRRDRVLYFEYEGSELIRIIDLPSKNSMVTHYYCDIVIDNNDISHVVYSELYPGEESIYYARIEQSFFYGSILIGVNDHDTLFPEIAVDSFNNPHIVWVEHVENGRGDLFYRTFNGLEWLPKEELLTTHDQGFCNVICDTDDTPYVFWDDHVVVSDEYLVVESHKPRTEPGIAVSTNQVVYTGGDRFLVELSISNPGDWKSVDQYIVLEVGDEYLWYPAWESTVTPVRRDLSEDHRTVETLLELTLPLDLSPGGPYRFYAAFCEPDTVELVGSFSYAQFSFE